VKEESKKLRGYLKGYRMCLMQAKSIEKQLAEIHAVESVRELLLEAKENFEEHCRNVQIILGQTKVDGIERSVMNLRYIEGKSIKEAAKAIGYSVGHCANVEADAVDRLSRDPFIMGLIG